MSKINIEFVVLCFIFAVSCNSNQMIENTTKNKSAPQALKVPTILKKHGDQRIDNYHWMRLSDAQKNAKSLDAQTQEVFDYLKAENSYFDAEMESSKDFQAHLFEEMKGRIKEDDSSVPYKKNGYFYVTKYKTGKQYPIYTRKKENTETEEEILFDVNEMASGHDYYHLGGFSVSPDNRKVVYSVDTLSRRQYSLYIKDLQTGIVFKEIIENTTGGGVWSNDNRTFFYTKKDPVTLRGCQIMRHVVGTDSTEDVLVYEERDETYGTFVTKSKSQQFLVIGSFSTLSTEYQILEADKPEGAFRMVQAREKNLEYSIAHFEDSFYILTNKDGSSNFKLMKTPIDNTEKENWKELIPHRKDVLLEDISVFKDHMVLEERCQGLNLIRIKKWDHSEDYYLPFEEETYSAYVYSNPEFDTPIIRYGYNSMTTPNSVIDFNTSDQSKEIKKEQEVLGGKFDKNNYTSKREWVMARDGKKIAISMVYRNDCPLNSNRPFLLYAYGSYGHTVDPSFSATRLSLLDRGFVFGIAHIRGSEYLGRAWYEEGKLLNKMNTFNDFIDCSKHVIAQSYTSEKHLYAMGGSAGGLLMGAIINKAPELYHGVIASVPFVDVVSTMLDETIPLTTGEYDEWGNPNDKMYYDYIKSYSPYDNVDRLNYPNLLVTTGLHDSQVQYWEPAKWVAKLRDHTTGANKILLHTDMETGHGGASGRFDALKETARDYTFLLGLENKLE